MDGATLQVCQCFVFCALLEFALVNYASRSDMQRDRARERMERARRQWELEHGDIMQAGGPDPANAAQDSQMQGHLVKQGGSHHSSMNHISSHTAETTADTSSGFSLVSKPNIHMYPKWPAERHPLSQITMYVSFIFTFGLFLTY